ncbi:MAG: hypothetical protein IPH07_12425 [Deltaproteobacteria bacterium]|nr:hypothetical protein [Deltaproteobacteria bacterium]MBK8717117.1 hypothetical protein [Deltaproteobacteria bacterium]MBP7286359.1 hypothetical protein [Nannocystaceae bacterium]
MDESRVRAIAEQSASLREQGPHEEVVQASEPGDDARRAAVHAAFSALTDAELESAIDDEDPDRRLAACWRVMLRQQSLPTTPPDDGVRLLLLVNLAAVQSLDLLETLAVLDPCASVRAAAATLLWRVARDRDRVVDVLVARLACERSSAVLVSLLQLVPPLPIDRVRAMVRRHADHPASDVRGAAEALWQASGAPPLSAYEHRWHASVRARAFALWSASDRGDRADLVARLRSEVDANVRACVFGLWARSDGYAELLPVLSDARLRGEVLAAWARHHRRVAFGHVAHLLSEAEPELVLAVTTGPYPPWARDQLLAMTCASELGRALVVTPELLRCLAEASVGASAPAYIDALRSRLADAEARLARSEVPESAANAAADDWFDESESEAEDLYWAAHGEVDAMLRILGALDG